MHTPNRKRHLKEIASKLGLEFPSEKLFNQSLTHSSYVNEFKKNELSDNERLEFLGDAVLKLVISEYLYKKYPDKAEGDLTKIRGAVISDAYLVNIARDLELGKYILLGKNEKASGGDKKKSNTANALEAIIGVIYLEFGIEKSKEIIIKLMSDSIEKTSAQDFIIDYKSALQEYTQKNKNSLPYYSVVKELGPKHRKIFWIEVKIENMPYGLGRGHTKKEAEQKAAKKALDKLKEESTKE